MGVEEPTITQEPGSHVRRQGLWKPISVPNRFGINGKEKPPHLFIQWKTTNWGLKVKNLTMKKILDI